MRLSKRVEYLEKRFKRVTLWDYPSDSVPGEFNIEDLFADILKRLSALEKKE
jgi:hypothetical protein